MTERIFSVTESDSLATVYDLMDSLHVRHIPVIEKGGRLLGLVSQRDLMREALTAQEELPLSQQRDFLDSRKVTDIMDSAVETVSPEEDIAEAGRIILENKFGCLPVIDDEHLVGILTEADFVSYVVRRTEPHRREKVA